MKPIAIVFDLDGTLFDTMGPVTELAVDMINAHFGRSRKWIRERFHETAGFNFATQLELLFPKATRVQRAACVREFRERKRTYGASQARPFADARAALEALSEKGVSLFVSSGAENAYARACLKKYRLLRYFSRIFGSRNGHKTDHLRVIQKDAKPSMIVFVGDSLTDVAIQQRMAYPRVMTVGRYGSRRDGMRGKRELLEAGATYAIADLRALLGMPFVTGSTGKAHESSANQ
jgi:phosphoglycolate phosphatase